MSDIRIDEIRFKNFRQYGTGIIRFDYTGENQLAILIAQNGTGKTTLLNAITWCLYDREYQISNESKALPRLNTDILKKSEDDKVVDVSVTLSISVGDKIIDFCRVQKFIVKTDSNGLKKAIEGPSQLSVSTMVKGDFTNPKTVDGEVATLMVKEYFDNDIYDFYFFDGENLKTFFLPGREEYVKAAIDNISQVTLLNNVISHVKYLIANYTRALGKISPDIERLQSELEKQEDKRQRAIETRDSANKEIQELQRQRLSINEDLKKYEPIRKLQQEREELEAQNKGLENERAQLNADRSNFIRRYTVLIKLYPSMKKILTYIADKEAEGNLPPSIDIAQVKELLDIMEHHSDKKCMCPLCDQEIGDNGREHLEKLLSQAAVSSRTSNFLKEIKGPLQLAVEETLSYKEKRKILIEREKDISSREEKVANRLAEINRVLIHFENSDDDKVNVSELEAKRSRVNSNIEIHNQSVGSSKQIIALCDDEIERINLALEKAKAQLEEKDETQLQLEVVKMMQKYYEQILSKITGGMKNEIENTTKTIFEEMNWKINTFGKMVIDEDYVISIFDQDGLEMTTTLSATEQMALAYAFILAIHEASGQNCPLVIDSPIGRSSDVNRENIAKSLLKISETKQIIMLFTPDDYTEPVQKLYENCSQVKKLKLSSNEKFVEGMDR